VIVTSRFVPLVSRLARRVWATVLVAVLAAASSASAQTIAGGEAHTVVVKPEGTVWTFGSNDNGQLGDNSLTTRKTPIQVSGLTDVIAVAAGADHSLALTSTGIVYAWGDNGYGQLGDNSTTDRKTPVTALLSDVVAIAAGEYHTLALQSNGVTHRKVVSVPMIRFRVARNFATHGQGVSRRLLSVRAHTAKTIVSGDSRYASIAHPASDSSNPDATSVADGVRDCRQSTVDCRQLEFGGNATELRGLRSYPLDGRSARNAVRCWSWYPRPATYSPPRPTC
jgi:hypothetical protein